MPAPRNIEELEERTLGQVAALKAKNVKVSGRGIFEFMSSGNLTGPPHRDIAAKMPLTAGGSMIRPGRACWAARGSSKVIMTTIKLNHMYLACTITVVDV